MKRIIGTCFVTMLAIGTVGEAQTPGDEEALRRLPRTFSEGFAKHDAHALAEMMSDDVDYVTVGLTWLHGRTDFEKYHARLFAERFKEVSHTVLQTNVRFLRPDMAVVRHSWTAQGDKNPDGSARPQRYGMMMMLAEKKDGRWIVVEVQNINSPTDSPARTPEADDIKSPIVVPRVKR